MAIIIPKKELLECATGAFILISEEAAGFVTPSASFETVLQSLLNHEHWFDSLSLLAHALAPRQAIWWGGLVCGYGSDQGLITQDPEAAALLLRVREWVMHPTEERRADIHDRGIALSSRAPAHWVAMAVFWSTGNITPDAGVVTPPPPYLYARGVIAAIDLAASLSGMARVSVYEHAIGMGIDIANGGSGDSATASE